VKGDGAKRAVRRSAEWDDRVPRTVSDGEKAPPGGPGGALLPGSAYSPLALRPRDQIRL
jgi:hypothetical protein